MFYTKYESSASLDEVKSMHKTVLEGYVPGIEESQLKNCFAFIELLNDYDGPTFRGIYGFLEDKGYETKAVKKCSPITELDDEQIDGVKSGRYVAGFKYFFEEDKDGMPEETNYIVIAKKKDKIDFETMKNKVFDLLFKGSTSSN